MNAPVDVLGWIETRVEREEEPYRSFGVDMQQPSRAESVSAAAAELFAAAKDVDAGSGGCPCSSCERLRAAIAWFGGAK